MKITRKFKFEAAHRLPFHDGKCRRPHGHSYQMELALEGPVRPPREGNPQSGFVVDFGVLDEIIKNELIDGLLDHYDLNEKLPEIPYTSAEYLAAWIVGWCIANLETHPDVQPARVVNVRLWETVNAWVEADRRDAVDLEFAPPAAAPDPETDIPDAEA